MTDVVPEYRNRLISAHNGSPYYEQAETAAWLAPFWSADSRFLPLFNQLDLSNVIEFACGHGRHTAQFVDRAGRVTLIDANATNIDACRRRFVRSSNVRCEVNVGTQLPCASRSYNAFFSYDALVHFEATDVISLLSEIARVLKPGGRALLHYSNYQDNPTGTYSDNPHWRNFFSEPMMLHFASRAGLHSLDSMTFPWSNESGTDALTLLELA
jgi:SAM-dependent methyltransferase